jgi:hypothetical protein
MLAPAFGVLDAGIPVKAERGYGIGTGKRNYPAAVRNLLAMRFITTSRDFYRVASLEFANRADLGKDEERAPGCSGKSQDEQRSIIAEISAAVCGDLLHNCSLGIQRASIAGARSLKEPLLAKFFQPSIFRLRDAVGGEE